MSKNKIIIIVVAVVVGILAYMYLTRDQNASSDSLVAENKTSTFADASDILNLLNRMNQIKLDDSVFSNQVFVSLKDTTVTLVSQQTGRNNPFAPLGADTTKAQPAVTAKSAKVISNNSNIDNSQVTPSTDSLPSFSNFPTR